WRGDADEIDVFMFEDAAVILGDAVAVGRVEAALRRGGAKALRIAPPRDLAAELDVVVVFEAVPDIADGDRGDGLSVLGKSLDEVDVGLGAAAAAEEGDAEPVVCADHAPVPGRGQRYRGGRA